MDNNMTTAIDLRDHDGRFTLPPLPYALDALEPHLGATTLAFHHGKHLAAYINNMNNLLAGSPLRDLPLRDIVLQSEGAILNNAAQALNHLFYFEALRPATPGPNNLMSMSNGGRLGFRRALPFNFGIWAGFSAVMLLCNVAFPTLFSTQLLIHCILLLGLVLGFSAVVGASAKVGAVHAREEQLRSGLDDLKQRVRQLQRVAAGIPDLPAADRSRIDALAGELRFVAPCRTAEAAALEKEFGEALQTLEFALPAHAMNRGAVESALARAERLCAERKTLYTN